MARLFISHSSRDNVYALAFQGWLAANGWDRDDAFIDLDDIGAGERWRDTLRKANAACEAVILLASSDSLSSVECQKEIELAEALGKEIITAIIRDLAVDDPRLARFSERHLVDLSAFPRDHVEALTWQGQDHRIGFNAMVLAKIRERLSALGISPGSFPWPPKDRPNAEPYPGLSAFDEDDAGVFFGRDADIMAALTEIRLVRRRRAPRLIVIDAASGAGKSSFLRAGLWPRLRRDPDFAPLALLRPSQGILTGPDGLGRRLAPFFERHQQPRGAGTIYAPLMAEDQSRAGAAFAALMSEAVALATQVRRAGNPEAPPPAPLIAIDQAEEMFAAENSAESGRFLAMLAAFLTAPPEGIDPYALVTIRADSVQQLLDAVAALGLETPKPLYLPPLASPARSGARSPRRGPRPGPPARRRTCGTCSSPRSSPGTRRPTAARGRPSGCPRRRRRCWRDRAPSLPRWHRPSSTSGCCVATARRWRSHTRPCCGCRPSPIGWRRTASSSSGATARPRRGRPTRPMCAGCWSAASSTSRWAGWRRAAMAPTSSRRSGSSSRRARRPKSGAAARRPTASVPSRRRNWRPSARASRRRSWSCRMRASERPRRAAS